MLSLRICNVMIRTIATKSSAIGYLTEVYVATNDRFLLPHPAALAFVSYGVVLVRVRIRVLDFSRGDDP